MAYIEREVEGGMRKGDEDGDRKFGLERTQTRMVTPLMKRNIKKGNLLHPADRHVGFVDLALEALFHSLYRLPFGPRKFQNHTPSQVATRAA